MDTVTCPHCGKCLDLVEYEGDSAIIVRGVAKLPRKDHGPILVGLVALCVAVLAMVVAVRERPAPAQATRQDWKP